MKDIQLARRLVLMGLFTADLQQGPVPQDEEALMALAQLSDLPAEGFKGDAASLAYARDLLAYIQAHQERIDDLLQTSLPKRPLYRLAALDRAILRLGLGEILREETPGKRPLYINEAVELAKLYSDGQSPQLINAILDGIMKDQAHDLS